MGTAPAADDLQVQARALGDPTRSQIFRYLGDANGPVDVRELTDHFGFNHNAIRQHLAKLLHAGLIVEEVAPSTGRGRPRHVYSTHPTAAARWGGVNPYEQLALLMSEMIRTGDDAVEVGRRAGRRQGLAGKAGTTDNVAESMARLGFEPVVSGSDPDAVQMVLNSCPFETAALADPDTVCALHLGMVEGVAEAIGDLEVDELRRTDPRHAHCVLHMRPTEPEPVAFARSSRAPRH